MWIMMCPHSSIPPIVDLQKNYILGCQSHLSFPSTSPIMCKSYSSTQMGFVNFTIMSINLPSLLLGVVINLSIWMICRFRSSCKVFGRRQANQSLAWQSIAQSLGGRHATPTVLPPARATYNLFFDL